MTSEPVSPRYRRRHRWPMLVALVVLLVGAAVVWTQVLKPAPPQATGCNEPGPVPTTSRPAGGTGASSSTSSGAASGTSSGSAASGSAASGSAASGSAASGSAASGSAAPGTAATATGRTPTGSTASGSAASGVGGAASAGSAGSAVGVRTSTASSTKTSIVTSLGTFTDPNVLAAERPADPSQIPLRVFNASTVIGQAKTVTDELRDAGFTSIGPQENDPLYPAADLRCYGEIRYGWAGLAEARTVLIVAPCAQLVRDDRADNSVDLSLGKLYQLEPISVQVRDELTQIKNASAPPPVIEGQTISIRPVPSIPPLPDRSGCPA